MDSYHLNDYDEDDEDEPEERGSRTYPSRTAYGKAWEIGEKHPNLMASKSLLFGLITIPMYEYRCVLSMAQIELLRVDKTTISYRMGKKKKFKRPNMIDVLDKAAAWENKYKNGEKPKLNLEGFVKIR